MDTNMEDNASPPKRRRLDDGGSEASSDELGANSDLERRRGSWSKQDSVRRTLSPREEEADARKHARLSESGDELTGNAKTYRSRSRSSRSRSRSISESSRSRHRRRRDDNDEEDASDVASGKDDDDESRAESPDRSMRTATSRSPSPPPPPPKPERLYYREKFVLKGHQKGVSAAKFSPNGSMIASCSADATIKVWDTATGKLIHTFEGHLAGVSTLSWSPDGSTLASGSDDKSIRLWNVLTGKPHPTPFLGHHNYVYSVALSPKGNMLVSGSYDEAVFMWDVRSARVMRSLPAHSDPVAGIDVVRDGTLIASCSTDGLIRIWDSATGQCLRTLVHEDNPPVASVKFSPNGKFVLAWTLDGCVRLWNYVEGRCVKTYQGHKNAKFSLGGGFGVYNAPNGPPIAFAVSGSEDGAVLCWDVVSKNVLQKLEGHTDVVLGVDAHSNSEQKLIVSCGLDRTVRVWEEIPPDKPSSGELSEGVEDAQDNETSEKVEVEVGVDGDTTMA